MIQKKKHILGLFATLVAFGVLIDRFEVCFIAKLSRDSQTYNTTEIIYYIFLNFKR